MPALRVDVKARSDREVVPAEFAIQATFTNLSSEPVFLNIHQASHPALVLQVLDEKNEPVLMSPPSAPDKEDLAPGERLEPGQSITLDYAGFLDRDLPGGLYRVRYFSPFPALGGSKDDPIASEWLTFQALPSPEFRKPKPLGELLKPRPDDIRRKLPGWLDELIQILVRMWCWVYRWFNRKRCQQVLERDVDEARTETISNAPAGSEAWNGTYSWRARFHVTIELASSRVTVTVRVRTVGQLSDTQRAAWESAIETATGNLFKVCIDSCCCPNGLTIVTNIEFIASGENQVVNAGASTTNMGNWGRTDTIDINHEFMHMLGALDEYFTVNGVNYGIGRQPTGNMMNNPANPPIARHYELIRAAVQDLLGGTCIARRTSDAC